MKKRAPAKKTGAKAGAKAARAEPSRALLVIDEGPIRAQTLEGYYELEAQITEARSVLDLFESADLPAHQRWEASAFGSLLTQLRQAASDLQKKQLILRAISEEIFWTGCSELTAYRRVMRALEAPEPEPEDDDEGFGADMGGDRADASQGAEGLGDKLFGDSDLPPGMTVTDFDRMPAREKRAFRDYYEEMAELYEMATGRFAPDLDDLLRDLRRAQRPPPTGAKKQPKDGPAQGTRMHGAQRPEPEPLAPAAASAAQRVGDRLKELYRQLVRQLHPDHYGEHTARERELWHQLQEAHRTGDLELMEALAGRIELGQKRSATKLPIQILLRLMRDLRESLKGLRRQIAAAKRSPAWRFSQRTSELPELEARQRKLLERDLKATTSELEQETAILEDLAARAAKSKKRSKAKPKPKPKPARYQDSFDF